MTDGQSETCESIARQNAAVSVRLERGESVRWHDGEQWQTGVVLTVIGEGAYLSLSMTARAYRLVQNATGIYAVDRDALEPYPPRCEKCDGEGKIKPPIFDPVAMTTSDGFEVECPACGGSGRRRA